MLPPRTTDNYWDHVSLKEMLDNIRDSRWRDMLPGVRSTQTLSHKLKMKRFELTLVEGRTRVRRLRNRGERAATGNAQEDSNEQ